MNAFTCSGVAGVPEALRNFVHTPVGSMLLIEAVPGLGGGDGFEGDSGWAGTGGGFDGSLGMLMRSSLVCGVKFNYLCWLIKR